jgi:hypothetical protein
MKGADTQLCTFFDGRCSDGPCQTRRAAILRFIAKSLIFNDLLID